MEVEPGAPFEVIERQSGQKYLAQMKPVDDELHHNIQMHNMLDAPDLAQLHQAVEDRKGGRAVLVYKNADQSFLQSLLAPERRSRSTTPKNSVEPGATQTNREDQVRVFVKQLLTSLQYMHRRNIAHLDLRPEVILLQDDHLRLADFGQSRHLLCGKVSGDIKSNPEFVAPEIIDRKYPITLAADMWSVGTLTYVLLFGQSPFIGDNDEQTLQNVVKGDYVLEDSDEKISAEAKNFLQRLLLLEPYHRMNSDQALQHSWLDDPKLGDAELSTDCLREFKYKHKWLERRVFVQQTPSEQLIQLVETPISSFCSSAMENNKAVNGVHAKTEPLAIYDYLKIKESAKTERVDKKLPISAFDAAHGSMTAPSRPPPPSMPPPLTPEKIAEYQKSAPPVPEWIKAQLPKGVSPEDLVWDPRFGGGFYLPPDKHPQGSRPAPQLPPRSRSSSAERPHLPRVEPLTPEMDQKIQSAIAAHQQRASPNKIPAAPQITQISPSERQQLLEENPLIKLIRGEKRPIQEELANRILSDISEEGSVTGSMASSTGPTIAEKPSPQFPRDDDASSTTTTQIEEGGEPSSGTVTPIPFLSPPEATDENGFSSKNLPLNEPLYIDEHLLRNSGVLEAPDSLTGCKGKKSPVLKSPSQEHAMSVVVATSQKPYRPLIDVGFDLLMDSADRLKKDLREEPKKLRRQTIDDDLDKYRPKHFFKPPEIEAREHKLDPDDYAWESTYQIGPETLLLPVKGAEFNARVRDYRRELWGDGAPYVRQGILGWRNADITVRERRRFTDLIREEPLIAQSVDTVNADLQERHEGAIRRVQTTENLRQNGQVSNGLKVKTDEPLSVEIGDGPKNGKAMEPSPKNAQQLNGFKNGCSTKTPPIFRTRLRDACFVDGAATTKLECYVVGTPTPEVTFYHHESALVDDGRHQIVVNDEVCRLIIQKPIDRVDTGEYSCVAVNELGRDKCSCRLICGDAPGKPSRPEVELSADTEVYINWDPPERIPITMIGITYRLELRQVGEDGSVGPWTIVSNRIEDEAVVLKHLHPMGIYQFRVTSKNEFGWGEPSITSRIIRTHPRGVPKFNLDVLRREGRRFAVVTTPQKSSKRGTGLTEISEEFAEEEEEEEEAAASQTEDSAEAKSPDSSGDQHSPRNDKKNGNGSAQIALNSTEDPLKRFQLESELFRGHFSVIRYAVDSKTGAHCTVKIRAPPTHGPLLFATAAERMKSLLSEYQTLADCQHENVVNLIAAYNSNNFLLLFTERLYDNVLQRFLYYDTYNEEQICVTIKQLASALRWIHFKGIVHLDVEPSNIMFASKRSWVVKLIDFGRARSIDSLSTANAIGKSTILAGDGQRFAEWTAPEILRLSHRSSGKENNNTATTTAKPPPPASESLTPQTDMWGLGLITFCLLGGFHPFAENDDTEAEVRENVLNKRCDPNLIPVQASEESLRFVTWALKKDPNRRMRPEEALNHRFLASDASMVRRRQGIQYSCNRLRRTAERRFRQQNQIARNGIDHSPVPADQRTTLQVPNGGANNIGSSINGSGPNRQKSPVENGKLKPPAAKPDSSSTLAEIAKNRRLAALI